MPATAATIADPPRRVPGPVRTRLLFGGIFGMLGWTYLLFGTIFGWIFSWYCESPFVSYGATTPGLIERIEATSSKENSRRVHEITYRFTAPGGKPMSGTSYTTRPPEDPEVTVEYDPDDPQTSRVVGMRARPFGAWVIWMLLLFPLTGVVFAAIAFVRGRRSLRLLVHGRLARGKLVDKKQTRVRVNKRMVYAMTFEFESAPGEQRRAVARTHTPELLEDEVTEALLYDPHDTARATLLDHLPGKPRVGDDGQLAATSRWPSWLHLVAPVGTVVANLLFLLVI